MSGPKGCSLRTTVERKRLPTYIFLSQREDFFRIWCWSGVLSAVGNQQSHFGHAAPTQNATLFGCGETPRRETGVFRVRLKKLTMEL